MKNKKENKNIFLNEVNRRINRFTNIALDLNNCLRTYMQLKNYKEEESDFISISPAFFQISLKALIYELFIESAKLFDTDKQNESIYRLLIECKEKNELFDNIPFVSNHFNIFDSRECTDIVYANAVDMIDKNLLAIEEVKQTMNSIRTLRNKFYAHYDKKVTQNKESLYQMSNLDIKDFKKILILNFNICNDFNNLLNKVTVYPFMLNVNDLDRMLFQVNSILEE